MIKVILMDALHSPDLFAYPMSTSHSSPGLHSPPHPPHSGPQIMTGSNEGPEKSLSDPIRDLLGIGDFSQAPGYIDPSKHKETCHMFELSQLKSC